MTFRNRMIWRELDPYNFGQGQVTCHEHSNEPLGSTQCGEFFDQLSAFWLPQKDAVPWL